MTDLKEAASRLHQNGFRIIPYVCIDGKKKPDLAEWKKWQTRPQTDEEFANLHFENYSYLGILTGTPVDRYGETFYIVAVDRDIKKLPAETLHKTKQACDTFPATWHDRTQSGGDHYYFLSKKPVENRKLHAIGLELFGLGTAIIVAPSQGYQSIGSDLLAQVEDLETIFNTVIAKAGLQTELDVAYGERVANVKVLKMQNQAPIRPCFSQYIGHPEIHLNHTMKLGLVNEFAYSGEPIETCKQAFYEHHSWEPQTADHQEAYDKEKTDYQINGLYGNLKDRKVYYRFKRESLQAQHACIGNTCPLWNQTDCRQKVTAKPSFIAFCEVDEKGHPRFKPALCADWIREHHHFKTDIKTGTLYYYDGEVWNIDPDGEAYLKPIVADLLGIEDTRSRFNDVRHHLTGCTTTEIVFGKKLAVENGLLNLETGKLEPFSPDEMPFHKLPVTYDPEAKCPNWEKFVSQIVDGADQLTLQEWSGFLLCPDYRYNKMLFMHGQGRNGKGRWAMTMSNILGNDNVSNIDLEEFDGEHRFSMYQLYGKLLNLCNEPRPNVVMQTNLVKKATGEDMIDGESKNRQQRQQFRNAAKITVLANQFPRVKDRTTAFSERRMFIDFPHQFTGANCIPNIEKQWLENPDERSGILNWMLAGWARLVKQNGFTQSKTGQEVELQFLRASDTVGAFMNEMLEYTGDEFGKVATVTRADAYKRYQEYTQYYELYTASDKAFTAALKANHKVTETQMKDSNKKTVRGWKGIILKELPNEETKEPEPQVETAPVQPKEVKQTILPTEEPIKVRTLLPNEPHQTCGHCQAIEAEYSATQGNSGERYMCRSCLTTLRQHCETTGAQIRNGGT